MKKLLVLAAVLVPGLAFGETVCTDLGCVTANEGGYLAVVDGAPGNPDPADGFVSVSSDGHVCADDNGTADDGNSNNGPESESPTCDGLPPVGPICPLYVPLVDIDAPLGCVTANEGGYLAVVDGEPGNPDPADGFVSVGNGGLCADDNGTADDGDPNNGPESTSPTCLP